MKIFSVNVLTVVAAMHCRPGLVPDARLLFPIVLLVIILTSTAFGSSRINLDYDNKADFLVFRPNEGRWYGFASETSTTFAIGWGIASDKIVPGDYDGDGITDVAVFRPATGVWYIRRSLDSQLLTFYWGLSGDTLVPRDYDGDGVTDPAVWRSGIYYVLTSSSGFNPRYVPARSFVPPDVPIAGLVPVPADYDGDGKIDFAAKFLSAWFISRSSDGVAATQSHACNTGYLVPADFTGDDRADPACVYTLPDVRYIWSFRRSDNGLRSDIGWGSGPLNDLPTPDDFDGDGATDSAIYRQGQWWVLQSSGSIVRVFNWGTVGDVPAQSANLVPN